MFYYIDYASSFERSFLFKRRVYTCVFLAPVGPHQLEALGNKLASITRTLLRQALHLVQKRTTRGQLKRTTHLLITSTSARRFHVILITGVIIKQDFEKNNRNPTYLAKV